MFSIGIKTKNIILEINNNIYFFFNFVFFVALLGVTNNRNNLMLILICVELCYLMIISLFLCSSFLKYKTSFLQGYCLFFLAIAASESAVGLSILIITYKNSLKTKINNIQVLYG